MIKGQFLLINYLKTQQGAKAARLFGTHDPVQSMRANPQCWSRVSMPACPSAQEHCHHMTQPMVWCVQHTYGKGARARRARRAGALSGGDDSDIDAPAGQGTAQRRQRAPLPGTAAFTEAQKARLVQLFEEHGMHRGYMAALLAGLGGDVRKSAVHRELRAMGLRKGALTGNQARSAQDEASLRAACHGRRLIVELRPVLRPCTSGARPRYQAMWRCLPFVTTWPSLPLHDAHIACVAVRENVAIPLCSPTTLLLCTYGCPDFG